MAPLDQNLDQVRQHEIRGKLLIRAETVQLTKHFVVVHQRVDNGFAADRIAEHGRELLFGLGTDRIGTPFLDPAVVLVGSFLFGKADATVHRSPLVECALVGLAGAHGIGVFVVRSVGNVKQPPSP